MFNVNDRVIYGAQGVCTVAQICEKTIGNNTAKYYVLKPVYQENNTIFVPVENEVLTAKMHRVLSGDEIGRLIHTMPDSETIWIDDDLLRRKQYKEILSSGDRYKISAVIKTLYYEQCRRKESGKKLHQHDEVLLRQAETLLYDELALVLNIKPEQVLPFLNEQIGIDELGKN